MKIDVDGVIEFPRVRSLHYQHKGNIVSCRMEFYNDGSMKFTRDLSPAPSVKPFPVKGKAMLDRMQQAIARAQSRAQSVRRKV